MLDDLRLLLEASEAVENELFSQERVDALFETLRTALAADEGLTSDAAVTAIEELRSVLDAANILPETGDSFAQRLLNFFVEDGLKISAEELPEGLTIPVEIGPDDTVPVEVGDETVDITAEDLAKTLGITPEDLLKTLNITPEDLLKTLGITPQDLAKTLGITPADLLRTLGITPTDLESTIGITAEDLAKTLGITPEDLLKTLNITPEDLLKTIGITAEDLAKTLSITPEDLLKTIGIDPEDLAATIGINPEDLATVLTVEDKVFEVDGSAFLAGLDERLTPAADEPPPPDTPIVPDEEPPPFRDSIRGGEDEFPPALDGVANNYPQAERDILERIGEGDALLPLRIEEPVTLSQEAISAIGTASKQDSIKVSPDGKTMPVNVDGVTAIEGTVVSTIEGIPVVQLAPGTRVEISNTEIFSQELADVRSLIASLGGNSGG